jgi:hypothetical protein
MPTISIDVQKNNFKKANTAIINPKGGIATGETCGKDICIPNPKGVECEKLQYRKIRQKGRFS